jgi:hypothetical protein
MLSIQKCITGYVKAIASVVVERFGSNMVIHDTRLME